MKRGSRSLGRIMLYCTFHGHRSLHPNVSICIVAIGWFIDNQPDSGILGILSDVTAEEASRWVDGAGNRRQTKGEYSWIISQQKAQKDTQTHFPGPGRLRLRPSRSLSRTWLLPGNS